MFFRTKYSLLQARVEFISAADSFIDTFAPIPPPKQDDKWTEFFIEMATMGATAGLGKVVKTGTFWILLFITSVHTN